ncbi:MAG TPA: VOC family protein [Candidatus Angelobacter sp.]
MDSKPAKRVIGIGGVFFKAEDPQKLYAWDERHLGIESKQGEGASLPWRRFDDFTAWSIFPRSTTYFNPSTAPFMINYQVPDLAALLEALRADGVTTDPKREDYDYGRFAWITDPEGNRIELLEPPKKIEGSGDRASDKLERSRTARMP